MAPPGDGQVLKTRAISAVVLAPPALAAAWAGGYPFAALVALAAALMCWEWFTIVFRQFGNPGRAAAGICAFAALVAVTAPLQALGLVALMAVAAALVTEGGRDLASRLWRAGGIVYIGAPTVALVWLRGDPHSGSATVWWLLLVVWATDIGAYAFGRLIGGPLLLPVVSPKKTWAGLLGGMLCAALAGLAVAVYFGLAHAALVAVASAVMAVIAQVGDLFESWVKRRWGVKDSSAIIPGHGGVLDRVDGLLSAAIVVAVLTLVSGQPILTW
jgi:phosphatidate cytidylyltransferase